MPLGPHSVAPPPQASRHVFPVPQVVLLSSMPPGANMKKSLARVPQAKRVGNKNEESLMMESLSSDVLGVESRILLRY